MGEVRSGIVSMLQVSGDLINYKDALEFNVPLVLNGILQTHKVMQEFVRVGIKNHTEVTAQYIMFLVTNSRVEVVDSLRKEFKDLKDGVKVAEKKADSAEKSAKTAANKATEASAEIGRLRKLVDKKADK